MNLDDPKLAEIFFRKSMPRELKPEPVETETSTEALLARAQERLHESTDEDYIRDARSIEIDEEDNRFRRMIVGR